MLPPRDSISRRQAESSCRRVSKCAREGKAPALVGCAMRVSVAADRCACVTAAWPVRGAPLPIACSASHSASNRINPPACATASVQWVQSCAKAAVLHSTSRLTAAGTRRLRNIFSTWSSRASATDEKWASAASALSRRLTVGVGAPVAATVR
eukprot:scaffold109409_cov19-Tisochrysis_lutea.AAC.1